MSPSLARARRDLPVTAECLYFGTGSWGPISRIFAKTLRRATQDELHQGRLNEERFAVSERAAADIRRELAALIAVEASRLALTRNTSDGLESVIRQFHWASGDEVVCTQLEHQGLTTPLAEYSRRCGFSVRIAQVPDEGAGNLQWLTRCVTARTRMIAFSAVGYATGQRLPLEAIAEFAREHGIVSLLDAAQCVGAMPLNLAQCPIDFCAFPLQKWLLGPEGLGGLYVRDASYDFLLTDRFTQSRGVLEATAAHLAWLRDAVGWDFILARTRELAMLARDRFAGIAGVRLITPDDHAGLVTVETDVAEHASIIARARRRRLVFRSWPELGRYRFSTAFFNNEKEIAAAARLFRPR